MASVLLASHLICNKIFFKDDNFPSTAALSLPLRTAEIIGCKVFDKFHVSHVLLHRHILPACKLLKIAGGREKSKVICIKKVS